MESPQAVTQQASQAPSATGMVHLPYVLPVAPHTSTSLAPPRATSADQAGFPAQPTPASLSSTLNASQSSGPLSLAHKDASPALLRGPAEDVHRMGAGMETSVPVSAPGTVRTLSSPVAPDTLPLVDAYRHVMPQWLIEIWSDSETTASDLTYCTLGELIDILPDEIQVDRRRVAAYKSFLRRVGAIPSIEGSSISEGYQMDMVALAIFKKMAGRVLTEEDQSLFFAEELACFRRSLALRKVSISQAKQVAGRLSTALSAKAISDFWREHHVLLNGLLIVRHGLRPADLYWAWIKTADEHLDPAVVKFYYADARAQALAEYRVSLALDFPSAQHNTRRHVVRYGQKIELRNGRIALIMPVYCRSVSDICKINAWGSGLPTLLVATTVRDVLLGLCLLHDRGLAHCDVKLDNIMYTQDGTAALIDLGAATPFGQQAPEGMYEFSLTMDPGHFPQHSGGTPHEFGKREFRTKVEQELESLVDGETHPTNLVKVLLDAPSAEEAHAASVRFIQSL